jgi:hypothetical protein
MSNSTEIPLIFLVVMTSAGLAAVGVVSTTRIYILTRKVGTTDRQYANSLDNNIILSISGSQPSWSQQGKAVYSTDQHLEGVSEELHRRS